MDADMEEMNGDADPRVGTVLQNRYRIIERLAEGGMGVVYRGERLMLERTVAIKFLHASFAANPDSRKRFERELKAMSRLSHPNCVSVIDFGFDGSPYIVMEFVTGRTLKDELRDGRLPPGRAIYITNQILAALTHAHSQDMVHRDIKPANILLTNAEGAYDHVYVLDFGLAKFVSSARGDDLTASWMVLGTPSYMSPEQARGDAVDLASDVYSTGALLFELLTGEKLYTSENPIDTLQKHQTAPVPTLRERAPEVPFSDALEQVMRKALAKDPTQRFRTALEFAEALETVPEALYTPRASSQMRAQTGSVLALAEAAGLLPESGRNGRALTGAGGSSGMDVLSMADAMDVREASVAARAKSEPAPAAPAAKSEAGKADLTVPLQKQAEVSAVSNPPPETIAVNNGSGSRNSAQSIAAAPAAVPAVSLAGSARDTGSATTARTATTTSTRRSSLGSLVLLLIPFATAAAAWYVLSRPDKGKAEGKADQTPAVSAPKAADQKPGQKTDQPGGKAPGQTAGDKTAPAITGKQDPGTASGNTVDQPGTAGNPVAGNPVAGNPAAGATQTPADQTGAPQTPTDQTPGATSGTAGNAAQAGQQAVRPPEPAGVETIKDVEELIAKGRMEDAVQGIHKLRRTKFPKSAKLPYLLGNIYFGRDWWGDGLDAYQDALRLDRGYRANAKLNQNAILALSHDKARPKANALFLKYIGKAGLPYLRKAAKSDKNPKVRKFAASLAAQVSRRR